MRKYERVNLASDIYKQKSASRSPMTLKKVQSSQLQSNKKGYQNVCCPSCRYLFKIQKQNEKPKASILRNNKSQCNQQNQDQLNKQTQTQQYLVVSIKTSPKKEKIDKSQGNQLMKDNPNTDRIPQRPPHFDIKPVQNDRFMAMTDRKQQQRKEGFADVSGKKESPNKQNQKISNLINKSKQKEHFPARSAYLNSKVQKSKQKNRSMMERRQEIDSYKKYLITEEENELKSQIARELVNKIQLTEQINQIISYHMNLRNQELSVPSYCKMLIYDIQDRKNNESQRQKQKQKQKERINGQQNQKYAEDEFYYARVTQLKSRYQKDKDAGLKY